MICLCDDACGGNDVCSGNKFAFATTFSLLFHGQGGILPLPRSPSALPRTETLPLAAVPPPPLLFHGRRHSPLPPFFFFWGRFLGRGRVGGVSYIARGRLCGRSYGDVGGRNEGGACYSLFLSCKRVSCLWGVICLCDDACGGNDVCSGHRNLPLRRHCPSTDREGYYRSPALLFHGRRHCPLPPFPLCSSTDRDIAPCRRSTTRHFLSDHSIPPLKRFTYFLTRIPPSKNALSFFPGRWNPR